MSIEQRVQALIEIAEDYRAKRCGALLAAAREESGRIVAEARAAARGRIREALSREHDRLAGSIEQAQARLVTLRRVRMLKRAAAVLTQAWPRLEQALAQRWQSAAGRKAWVEQHLAVARDVLPAAAWTVLHPPGWHAAERDQALLWLRQHGIADARVAPDATLEAGIRVVCGMNVLDASLAGLLADRAPIEGRLLQYLEELR